jgi:hypothetical protein
MNAVLGALGGLAGIFDGLSALCRRGNSPGIVGIVIG